MRRAILMAFALGAVVAASEARAEFTVEDFYVRSAQDLVDICSVGTDSPDYLAAVQFCRGLRLGLLAVPSGPGKRAGRHAHRVSARSAAVAR